MENIFQIFSCISFLFKPPLLENGVDVKNFFLQILSETGSLQNQLVGSKCEKEILLNQISSKLSFN